MLWKKYEKERLERTYHAKLPQTISRLEKMDISSLSQVYCTVATEGRKLIQNGGRTTRMVIEHTTMKQVIRLSEHFRQYTSVEWSIGWKELGIREKKD